MPSPLIASTSLNSHQNSTPETIAIKAEAAHTPMCSDLSNWLNVAFSFARTTNTPMTEQTMPRPASAMGATASFIASAA
ncbi:MAG: hypothetical protein HC814_06350 [Rhodobacteraceae bacterium]|nr:hypothetical protein [Paracoccaceae bacterium]